MKQNIPDELLRRCADEALKCYGTAYIFEKRASKLKTKLSYLNFFGIAGPAMLGATIATYNFDISIEEVIKIAAGTIGVLQFGFTIWSMTEGWGDKVSEYIESKTNNYSISKRLKQLERNSTASMFEFESELAVIEKEIEIRNGIDAKHDVSDEEKRMGMRYGLRQYQRPCAGCKIVPIEMKPTSCGVCGQFKEKK
jgi:mobilome CxxCx(11)CxxC protein